MAGCGTELRVTRTDIRRAQRAPLVAHVVACLALHLAPPLAALVGAYAYDPPGGVWVHRAQGALNLLHTPQTTAAPWFTALGEWLGFERLPPDAASHRVARALEALGVFVDMSHLHRPAYLATLLQSRLASVALAADDGESRSGGYLRLLKDSHRDGWTATYELASERRAPPSHLSASQHRRRLVVGALRDFDCWVAYRDGSSGDSRPLWACTVERPAADTTWRLIDARGFVRMLPPTPGGGGVGVVLDWRFGIGAARAQALSALCVYEVECGDAPDAAAPHDSKQNGAVESHPDVAAAVTLPARRVDDAPIVVHRGVRGRASMSCE
jgi:hypothetical protein